MSWSVIMRLMAALMLVPLAACVGPIDQSKLTSIRTIGVASVCGREITRAAMGIFSIQNEVTRGDITSWGLDDEAVSVVASALQGRFDVAKAEFDPAILQDIRRKSILAEYDDAPIRAVRRDPKFDAYLVIWPTTKGNGAAAMRGMGIFTGSRHPEQTTAWLHSVCFASLYDRAGEVRLGTGRAEETRFMLVGPRQDTWNEYSAAERERVREILRELQARALTDAVAAMHLTPRR